MTGRRPGYYMLTCWKCVCPLIIALLIIVVLVNLSTEYKTYEAWNRETVSKGFQRTRAHTRTDTRTHTHTVQYFYITLVQ